MKKISQYISTKPLSRLRSSESIDLLIKIAWKKWEQTLRLNRSPRHALAEHLSDWARSITTNDGREAKTEDIFERWRWATLSLPADLLIGFASDCSYLYTNGPALPRQLQSRIDENGIYDPHVHLGDAASFGCIWTRLCRSPKLSGENNSDLNNLYGAAIIRVILALVFEKRDKEVESTLNEFGELLNGEQYHFYQRFNKLLLEIKYSESISDYQDIYTTIKRSVQDSCFLDEHPFLRQALGVNTCPSSNLLIGNLKEIANHPALRIHPLPQKKTKNALK